MSWHREDYVELKDNIVDYVKANPKKIAFIAAFAFAFALGVWARSVFGAPLPCDLTNNVLTCNIPASGGGPVDPPIPPSDPYAGCPVGTTVIKGMWDEPVIFVNDFKDQIVVVEVKVPASWSHTYSPARASFVENIDGAVIRQATMTTKACDFSDVTVLRSGNGAAMRSDNQLQFAFQYKSGPPTSFSASLTPGQTYYINIRNQYSSGLKSCNAGTCNMRGSLPD